MGKKLLIGVGAVAGLVIIGNAFGNDSHSSNAVSSSSATTAEAASSTSRMPGPTAPLTIGDAKYLKLMSDRGITNSDGPSALVAIGQNVCDQLDQGVSRASISSRMEVNGIAADDATFMITTANGVYCPTESAP